MPKGTGAFTRSYRGALAVRGMVPTMLLVFAARLPISAMGVTMTLYVLTGLRRGYAEAGLVGTVTMVGAAIGGPVVGRAIDRYGLRPTVAVCGVVSTAYWVGVPHVPYAALLAVAAPAGMLAVPATSIGRQAIAALVPAEHRRAAYSLDTISLETAFLVSPAVTTLVAVQVGPAAAMTAVGAAFGAAALALLVVNPPLRRSDEPPAARKARLPARRWLDRRMVAALLVAGGAYFVLTGMELAAIATLNERGEVAWTGVVIAVMSLASVAGGLVHGGLRRSLSQTALMALLALCTAPVGLAAGAWWLLALALVPANALCAPTMAASTEAISARAPAEARGEVLGLQDLACRSGIAASSPVVGLVLDHLGPAAGFAATGVCGVCVAAAAVLLRRTAARSPVGRETAAA